MPIVQVGATQTATAASGTSVVVTKPTGVADGDVLLAQFSHNDQAATATGWTLLTSEVNGAIFRDEMYYKIASSEGANYTFSVGAAAPLVASVTAWRGVRTDITPVHVHTSNNSAADGEPSTGPTTGATSVNTVVFYARSVRFSGSTVPTFSTAVGTVSEITDVGIFSGGSVCYSHSLYKDNSDNAVFGTKAGLAVTCSQAEANNVKRTLALAIASETDTITGTETESIAGTAVDTDTITITESEQIDIPVANSETATLTETEDLQQITEYLVSDNFNRDDESPLNISSSGHEWTNV